MKLIAHRGWSAGEDENTVAAFARTAWDDRISGVEFGVRYVADTGNLVVSHDPPLHIENALTLDPALSFLSQTALELFVEFKETGLASVVIEKLLSRAQSHRFESVSERKGFSNSLGSASLAGSNDSGTSDAKGLFPGLA